MRGFKLRRTLHVGVLALGLLGLLACGSTRDGGGDGGGDAGRDGAVGSGAGCSADLRDVLAEDGSVVQTCPPDQGCVDGACVPACDAASASRGTIACDFVVSSPPSYPGALPPCLAAFVANTWPTPARLTVTRDGAVLDVTRFARIVDNAIPSPADWAPVPASGVPEGAVAVLFLSSDPMAIMRQRCDLPAPCVRTAVTPGYFFFMLLQIATSLSATAALVKLPPLHE